MIAMAAKVGAAIAALVLLERVIGAKAVLARELTVKTDAKGCGACYRLTYLANGEIQSVRVDDSLCVADGLDGLGCPQGADKTSDDSFLAAAWDGLESFYERTSTAITNSAGDALREIA